MPLKWTGVEAFHLTRADLIYQPAFDKGSRDRQWPRKWPMTIFFFCASPSLKKMDFFPSQYAACAAFGGWFFIFLRNVIWHRKWGLHYTLNVAVVRTKPMVPRISSRAVQADPANSLGVAHSGSPTGCSVFDVLWILPPLTADNPFHVSQGLTPENVLVP